jgi:hypothetical protein
VAAAHAAAGAGDEDDLPGHPAGHYLTTDPASMGSWTPVT